LRAGIFCGGQSIDLVAVVVINAPYKEVTPNKPPVIFKKPNEEYFTAIDSISEVLDVADTVVESGTDRCSLVCEEKRKDNGGDGELHCRT
jgi:hypothetical protein